jgi:cell division protein FtsI/penicillin-binding protein 2
MPANGIPSQRLASALLTVLTVACSARGGFAASGCKEALAQLAVCETANVMAIDAMRSRRLEALSVMQDVATGALVVFAASQPSKLDVSTLVMPLSLSKVFLAASWWDNKQPDLLEGTKDNGRADRHASEKPVSVHEMLVGGSDSSGRQVALALRKSIGTQKVLADFHRYGFDRGNESFWAEVDPQWKKRLTPPQAFVRLDALNDEDWSSALSIGESYMMTTALQVSRFLQGVGNNGLLCAPVARLMARGAGHARDTVCGAPTRVVEETTARKLMAAMRDTVKRGTATRIASALEGIGWAIGGKTGTGGRAGLPMNEQDGWFAGLVFDREGKARYTVATFVRRGGLGGGNAAEISAQLARFVTDGITPE